MKKTIRFSVKTIIAILFLHLFATSNVFAALNGLNYTINPGNAASATNYQSITAAVNDLLGVTRGDGGPAQGPGISGQVEITVTASSYTYTGTINIAAIAGAGGGINSNDSVIINGGSAATSTLQITSSSGNNYLVQLDNCSYVTIENFTITSTLTAGYTFDGVIIEGPTSGSPVSHDDVINCTINMLSESAAASLGGAEFSGIVVNGFMSGDGNLPNISGYFSNIYLTGNTITNGHNGIVVFGNQPSPSGITITGNTITNFSSFGLDLLNIINPKIRNNVINGCAASNLAEAIGMNTAYNPSSTTDWTEISGNFITSQGRYAILLNGAGGNASQPTRIFNNMVYSYSTTLTAVRAISYLNSNNGYINIWDNSIVMNTPSTNTSGALSIESATNNADIRNNIFDYIGGSTGLPLFITTSSWVTNCDYNIFYNSAATNEASIGGTVYTNTTVVGGGGFNSHSVVANPNFVNTTYGSSENLHITALPASTCNRGDASTTSSSPMAVTTDYDGQTRATPPNIGADELIVTVSPATASICPGGPQTLTATPGTPWTPSSYSWSPSSATGSTYSATPTVNTTYTVSAIDANGCTAAQGTSVITIMSCGPNVYNMSGNGSSANPAVTLCASGLTLGMMNADAGVTYNLIQGASTVVSTYTPGTSGAFNFSYTPVAGYVYTVTATSTSTVTMNGSVTVNASPTVIASPTSVAICTGSSTTITSGGATTYTWSPSTGLSPTTGSSVTANPTTATTYTVTGTSSGCSNTATSVVTVNPLPTVTASPTTVAICTGNSTTLTSGGASTYTWSPVTGLSPTTGSSVTANPTVATTYTVTGTDGNGCVNTATSTVTVNPLPTVTASPTSVAICSGNSTTLTSGGATTYTWSPSTALSPTTGSSVSANPTVATTYTVTGTSSGCSNTATAVVTITPTVGTPSTPSGSTSLCFGASPTAYTTSATNATSYTWSVTGAGNSISGTGTTGTVTWNPTFIGNATVSVTATNSCGTSSAASVVVLVGGLNGTYIINPAVLGAANLYPNTNTFNSFASAIAALSSCGISGQVIFNVSAGTYTGNISIPSFNGAGVNNDSVIFNGGSAANCFLQEASYGNNGYLVELNSCSYVTFENFTLETNLTAGYTFDGVIIEGPNSSSPISHDDVINCTINMLSESAAVSLGGGTFSGIVVNGFTSGDGNIPNISGYFSNIYLKGNTITNGHYGIVTFGSGATPSGVTITGNTITGFSTFGLDMLNIVCPKIRNNVVNGCVASNLAEAIGMNTAANQSSTTDWVEISGNFITSQGRYGILLNGACGNSSQPTRIYNNMIYSSSTLTAARGISTLNSTFSPGNSYINYWNNSIVLNTSSTATSGALTLDNGAANSDIRNNILAFVGSTAGLPVVIPTVANISAFDYNIFYNSAATNEGSISGTIYTSATILNNNYGGSTTFNTNSQVTNPNFVSLTDLDITTQCQRGTNATLTVVPLDIHGTTRANPPCIGADEIPSSTPTLSGVSQVATVCSGTNVTINLTGLLYNASTGNTFTVNYTIGGIAQTPTTVTANSSGAGSFTVAVTSANNGQVLAITGLTNTSTTCSNTFSSGNSVTLSVNPLAGTPTTPSGTNPVCQGSAPTTFTTSATNATSYTWSISGAGVSSISGTGTTGTVTWDPTFSGTTPVISVTATNGCGTSSAATLNVTVTPTVGTPSTPSGSTTLCQGASPTAYTTSATNATSYTWSITGSGNSISGTGTTSTVTWSSTYSGTATISVTATNSCGTSSAATLNVTVTPTVGTPTTPSGSTSLCFGASPTAYTTSATGATSYTWSVTGTGNSISGTGTTGTVTWNPTFIGNATVSVTANGCGTSTASSVVVLVGGLNGTYTIDNTVSGAANLYPNTSTFNSFASAVAALACGVTGPVVFNVAAHTYSEQVIIPATAGTIKGASATNTITFNGGAGNAANVIVTSAGTGTNYATLTLDGCSYVTFENMTITNTNTTNAWGVLFYSSSSSYIVTNDQILNCVINVPNTGSPLGTNLDIYGILFSNSQTSPGSSSTAVVENCTISGCTINNGNVGIEMYGFLNTTAPSTEDVVSNCSISNYYADGVFAVADLVAYKIRGNTFTNGANSGTSTEPIRTFQDALSSSSTDNAEISGNTIYNFGEFGIGLQGTSGSATHPMEIFNNYVGGGLPPTGTASNIVTCVYCNGAASYINFWNNTFDENNNTTCSSIYPAVLLNATTSSGYINVENNIFQYSGTGASPTYGYPLMLASAVLTGSTIDYNIFYNTNSTAYEENINGTYYTSANVVGGGGINAHSQVINPDFVNTTYTSPDLDITAQCQRGTSIANPPGFTTDIHSNTRSSASPCIGADEIPSSTPTLSGVTQSAAVCSGTTATINLTGLLYNASTGNNTYTVNYTINGVTQTPATVTSNLSGAGSFTVTLTSANNGEALAVTGLTNTVTTCSATFSSGNSVTLSVNPLPGTPSTPSGSTTLCQGASPTAYTTSATNATSYTWSITGAGASTISGTGTTGTVIWDPTFSGTTPVISVTATNGCGTSSAATVSATITPTIGAPNTPTGITTTLCQGASPTSYTTTATNATSYTWSISGAGASTISGTGTTGTVTWDPNFSGTTAVISVTATNSCGTSPASSLTVTVNPSGTWVGIVSTNWDVAGNWCGGLPTATTDVIVPGSSFVPNQPEVKFNGPPPAGPAYCHNLTINSSATITVDGSGLLNIYGNVTNNGIFNNTAGEVAFRGNTLQTIPALTVNNCQVLDTPGLSLTGNLNVKDTFTLTTGIVTTNANNVTITSGNNRNVQPGAGNTNYLNSWVNGYLQRNVTSNNLATYDFPVGNSSYAEFLQWGDENIIGVSNLTASFGPKLGTDAGLNVVISGVPLDVVNGTGVWYLDPNVEPTGGSYALATYFGVDPGWSTRPDEGFTIITRPDTSTHASSWTAPGIIPATGDPGELMPAGMLNAMALPHLVNME